MSAIRRTSPLGEHLSAQSVLNRVLKKGIRRSNIAATGGQISKSDQGSTEQNR